MHVKPSADRAALLALTMTLLAGPVFADEAETWNGWDALPEAFLELTGENDAAELSARLDRLIRESGSTGQKERILEAWLRQLSAREDHASLESLLEASEDSASQPSQPSERPASAAQRPDREAAGAQNQRRERGSGTRSSRKREDGQNRNNGASGNGRTR